MLVLENVSVDLAGTPVLRNVSVELSAGSVVAVVGRNGAGKTTLLRTIMGLVKLKSGRILFDEDELHNLPPHWRAEQGIRIRARRPGDFSNAHGHGESALALRSARAVGRGHRRSRRSRLGCRAATAGHAEAVGRRTLRRARQDGRVG